MTKDEHVAKAREWLRKQDFQEHELEFWALWYGNLRWKDAERERLDRDAIEGAAS